MNAKDTFCGYVVPINYVLDILKNTLRKGILELKSEKDINQELGSRQRKIGGGRKTIFFYK